MSPNRRNQDRHQPSSARPGNNEARLLSSPPNYDTHKFVYRLRYLDTDGPWGWQKIQARWFELVEKLDQRQSMTWRDIIQEAGGRGENGGTNNHPVPVANMNACARQRLAELEYGDVDTLFSLRTQGTHRFYGFRREFYFDVLWYDDDHGSNNRCVYPTRPR